MIKPEIVLIKSGGFYTLHCIMKIPEKDTPFSHSWNIQPTTDNQWSLYQEITVLIGKSFETIRKDIEKFEKEGV